MTPSAPPTSAPEDAPKTRTSVKGAVWFRVALAALLLLPWVIGLGVAKVNENRRSTAFPSVDGGSLLDTTTYRQTDQALKDRLALKTAVIRAIGETSVAAGASLTDRVVTGTDGTAFSSEEFAKPCRFPFDAPAVDAKMSRWQDAARERGGDVFLAIAPDKSSIEREKLGRYGDDLLACADKARYEVLDQWGGQDDAVIMTLWDQMTARTQESPGQTYQRGDTHWTALGASVFAEEVVGRLAPQSPQSQDIDFAADVVNRGERERFGDLYRLMGSNRLDVVPVIGTERPRVVVKRSVEPGTTFRGVRTYRAVAPPGTPMIPGTTLIVHDSFYDAAEKQLTPYFEKSVVMHWSDLTVAAKNGTLPQVDRIVFETSQRSFGERVSVALADPDTQKALDQALGL